MRGSLLFERRGSITSRTVTFAIKDCPAVALGDTGGAGVAHAKSHSSNLKDCGQSRHSDAQRKLQCGRRSTSRSPPANRAEQGGARAAWSRRRGDHGCAPQTHNQTMVADPHRQPSGNRPVFENGCQRLPQVSSRLPHGCQRLPRARQPRRPVPIGTGAGCRPRFPLLGCQNRGPREPK